MTIRIHRCPDLPIVIPLDICRNKNLSYLARILYGEIDWIETQGKKGYCSKDLANIYFIEEKEIIEALKELESIGFISLT